MSDEKKELVRRVKAEIVVPEERALEARRVNLARARPQPAWISRLRTKQVEDYRALLEAETRLAGSAVEHRRALHRLSRVEEILEIDDMRLAQAKAAARREWQLDANEDAIRTKEQELRLAALDRKLEQFGESERRSREDQLEEMFEKKQRAIVSVQRKRDELIREVSGGRSNDELSDDELTLVENIRDDAQALIDGL